MGLPWPWQLLSLCPSPPGMTTLTSILDLAVGMQEWKKTRFRSLDCGGGAITVSEFQSQAEHQALTQPQDPSGSLFQE